jgi:hypothetical protein
LRLAWQCQHPSGPSPFRINTLAETPFGLLNTPTHKQTANYPDVNHYRDEPKAKDNRVMTNLTWPALNKLRREIDGQFRAWEKLHMGKAKHEELVRLIATYKRGREHLVSTERQLDNAEITEIRDSKRAPTEEKRRTYLEKVSRIRREKRKLHGEI